VLGCSYHLINENGEPLGTRQLKYFRHNIRNVLKKRNVFAHGSLMLRTDAYRQTGGYRPEFTFAQDYDLLLRLSTTWQIDFLDEPLYHLRLSKNSISASKTALQDYYAQLARKCHHRRRTHADDAPILLGLKTQGPQSDLFSPRSSERHLLNHAVHLTQLGRMSEARDVLRSVQTTNRTFRWTLLLISTFLPCRLLGTLYALKWRMETVL